ncbi:hypothetical protein [Marinomonas posidonica]|uniref:Uncharacterized protein n=1 Tax=Marinomonas posidonica (strain CECT 7376 / NCIMB 14433 / IVIA-Po-181) TaxID=491952 RepID=F6CVX9_MARPP|nr:hypothetical protein [Marinomonas posidonica]AEF54278.1 hypothetical protein Mar181_1231 [Marinomonas posidonica IVIA-Po-181]
MVSQADHNTTLPVIQYPLYGESKRSIIHQQEDVLIVHEHLNQAATPSRLYRPADNCFCFVIKGEVHLQSEQQAVNLKPHQAVWLPTQQSSVLTLLTPNVILCTIQFTKVTLANQPQTLQKISTGTVDSKLEKKHIQVWPLWEGNTARICIEKYPAHYSETLYYQKAASHYLLPLKGSAYLARRNAAAIPCTQFGQFIPAREASAIINPEEDHLILLTVIISKQQKLKGRVIVLNRPD